MFEPERRQNDQLSSVEVEAEVEVDKAEVGVVEGVAEVTREVEVAVAAREWKCQRRRARRGRRIRTYWCWRSLPSNPT